MVRASGKVEWVPDPSIRNEPLDLRVYARAAAELCGLSRLRDEHWEYLRMLASQQQPDDEPAPTQ